jgi:hypothetical protein
MELDYNKLLTKKGIIIIGSPRSGTHYLADGLYKKCKISNKKLVGEIYDTFDIDTRNILKNLEELKQIENFTFSHIVQFIPKNLLVNYVDEIKEDYYVINIRRKNKIEQYRSWCMARMTWKHIKTHSVNWELIKNELPFIVTNEDIDNFIVEQNTDYLWKPDEIVYYEDIKLESSFVKNAYTETFEELFSNANLIFERLADFKYV